MLALTTEVVGGDAVERCLVQADVRLPVEHSDGRRYRAGLADGRLDLAGDSGTAVGRKSVADDGRLQGDDADAVCERPLDLRMHADERRVDHPRTLTRAPAPADRVRRVRPGSRRAWP